MTTVHDEAPTAAPPKPHRAAWLIGGGVFTGLVLLLALTVVGVRVWAASVPEETASHTETYPQTVTGVDLDIDIGTMHLTGGDGDLRVRLDKTWTGTEPQAHQELSDAGVLEARAECRDDLLFWTVQSRCETDYSVEVPSGADTVVRADVGEIVIDGLEGRLHVASSVAGISAQHLRTTGTSIESDVGEIELSFDEVLGDIDVTAEFGDVTILVPDDGTTYDVRIDTELGEGLVHIDTDPVDPDHVITVTADIGEVAIRYAP